MPDPFSAETGTLPTFTAHIPRERPLPEPVPPHPLVKFGQQLQQRYEAIKPDQIQRFTDSQAYNLQLIFSNPMNKYPEESTDARIIALQHSQGDPVKALNNAIEILENWELVFLSKFLPPKWPKEEITKALDLLRQRQNTIIMIKNQDVQHEPTVLEAEEISPIYFLFPNGESTMEALENIQVFNMANHALENTIVNTCWSVGAALHHQLVPSLDEKTAVRLVDSAIHALEASNAHWHIAEHLTSFPDVLLFVVYEAAQYIDDPVEKKRLANSLMEHLYAKVSVDRNPILNDAFGFRRKDVCDTIRHYADASCALDRTTVQDSITPFLFKMSLLDEYIEDSVITSPTIRSPEIAIIPDTHHLHSFHYYGLDYIIDGLDPVRQYQAAELQSSRTLMLRDDTGNIVGVLDVNPYHSIHELANRIPSKHINVISVKDFLAKVDGENGNFREEDVIDFLQNHDSFFGQDGEFMQRTKCIYNLNLFSSYRKFEIYNTLRHSDERTRDNIYTLLQEYTPENAMGLLIFSAAQGQPQAIMNLANFAAEVAIHKKERPEDFELLKTVINTYIETEALYLYDYGSALSPEDPSDKTATLFMDKIKYQMRANMRNLSLMVRDTETFTPDQRKLIGIVFEGYQKTLTNLVATKMGKEPYYKDDPFFEVYDWLLTVHAENPDLNAMIASAMQYASTQSIIRQTQIRQEDIDQVMEHLYGADKAVEIFDESSAEATPTADTVKEIKMWIQGSVSLRSSGWIPERVRYKDIGCYNGKRVEQRLVEGAENEAQSRHTNLQFTEVIGLDKYPPKDPWKRLKVLPADLSLHPEALAPLYGSTDYASIIWSAIQDDPREAKHLGYFATYSRLLRSPTKPKVRMEAIDQLTYDDLVRMRKADEMAKDFGASLGGVLCMDTALLLPIHDPNAGAAKTHYANMLRLHQAHPDFIPNVKPILADYNKAQKLPWDTVDAYIYYLNQVIAMGKSAGLVPLHPIFSDPTRLKAELTKISNDTAYLKEISASNDDPLSYPFWMTQGESQYLRVFIPFVKVAEPEDSLNVVMSAMSPPLPVRQVHRQPAYAL